MVAEHGRRAVSAKGSYKNRTTRFADPAVLVPVVLGAWGRVWDIAWADGRSSDRMCELISVLASADAADALEGAETLPVLLALDSAWKEVEAAFTGRLEAFGYFPARIRIITALAHTEYLEIVSEAIQRMGPLPKPEDEKNAAGEDGT
ncbi:hypothetical protein AB0L06_19880 [Spirillospora sp. NPDC052269]